MTTRFSLSELADMLQVPVDAVREAVDALSQAGELTAESFRFGERSWRIAPSDTKRVQAWLQGRGDAAAASKQKSVRRVHRKVVSPKQSDLH